MLGTVHNYKKKHDHTNTYTKQSVNLGGSVRKQAILEFKDLPDELFICAEPDTLLLALGVVIFLALFKLLKQT